MIFALALAIVAAQDPSAAGGAIGDGAIGGGAPKSGGGASSGCPTTGCTFTGTVTMPELDVAVGGNTGILSIDTIKFPRYTGTSPALLLVGPATVIGGRTEHLQRVFGNTVFDGETVAANWLGVAGDGAGACITVYDGPGPGIGNGNGTGRPMGGCDGSGHWFAGNSMSATSPGFGWAEDVAPALAPYDPFTVTTPSASSGIYRIDASTLGITLAGISEYQFAPTQLLPGPARDSLIDIGSSSLHFKDFHSTGALTAGTGAFTSTLSAAGITSTGDLTCGTGGTCNIGTPSTTAINITSNGAAQPITLTSGNNKIAINTSAGTPQGLLQPIPSFGLGVFGGTGTGAGFDLGGSASVGEIDMIMPSTSATNINAYIEAGATYTQLWGGTGLIAHKDDTGSCATNALTADPKGALYKVTSGGANCTVTLSSTSMAGLLTAAGASLGTNAMSFPSVVFVIVDAPGGGHSVAFTGGALQAGTCTLTKQGGTMSAAYVGSLGKFVITGCDDAAILGASWFDIEVDRIEAMTTTDIAEVAASFGSFAGGVFLLTIAALHILWRLRRWP